MAVEIPATPEAPDVAISDPLTAREIEVLQAISAGLSNTDIAEALHLSVDTVKSHVKAILEKLQARNRTHAVVCALIARILLLPAPAPIDTKIRTIKSSLTQQAHAAKVRAQL